MCASVTFEVESIVETLAAERTLVALDVAVTLDVTVEEALEWKQFPANIAGELIFCRSQC